MKPFSPLSKKLILILMCCNAFMAVSQQTSQEKMAQLAYMVGDWEGTSSVFEKEGTKKVIAHEVVQYKADEHLIVINLESEALKLHTVIYYDEKEQTYYYCPFYKKGTGKYKGEFNDGKFNVWFNETRKLTFQLTPEGHFHEFGEQLKDGKWVKYFEDILLRKE